MAGALATEDSGVGVVEDERAALSGRIGELRRGRLDLEVNRDEGEVGQHMQTALAVLEVPP